MQAIFQATAEEYDEQEQVKEWKLKAVFERTFKALFNKVNKVSDMMVLGQVKGIKEELDQMIKKKEKYMEENSGTTIDGTRFGFNAKLN